MVYMAEEEKAGGQPRISHSGLFDCDSLRPMIPGLKEGLLFRILYSCRYPR